MFQILCDRSETAHLNEMELICKMHFFINKVAPVAQWCFCNLEWKINLREDFEEN